MNNQVTFLDRHTAILITKTGKQITVENAVMVIKKVGRRWARVLYGVVEMCYAGWFELRRMEQIEFVVRILGLLDRAVAGLQGFLREVLPGRFGLKVRIGSLIDFAMAW